MEPPPPGEGLVPPWGMEPPPGEGEAPPPGWFDPPPGQEEPPGWFQEPPPGWFNPPDQQQPPPPPPGQEPPPGGGDFVFNPPQFFQEQQQQPGDFVFDPYEPVVMNPDPFVPDQGQYPGGGFVPEDGGGYVPAPSYFEAPFQQGVSYVPLTEQGQSSTPQIFPVEDPNQMQGYESIGTDSSASQEYGGLVQGWGTIQTRIAPSVVVPRDDGRVPGEGLVDAAPLPPMGGGDKDREAGEAPANPCYVKGGMLGRQDASAGAKFGHSYSGQLVGQNSCGQAFLEGYQANYEMTAATMLGMTVAEYRTYMAEGKRRKSPAAQAFGGLVSPSQTYGGLVQGEGEAAVGACGCKNGGCKNKAVAGAQTSGCGCKGGCKNNNVPLQGQVQGQEQSASYNEMKHARTSPVACASCKVDVGSAAQVAAMSTFAMSPSMNTPMQRQVMSPQVTDGNQVDIVAIGAGDKDSEGSHKPRLGGHKPTLGGHKPTLGGESEDASVQRFYQYGYTEGVANRAEGRSYGSRPGFMEKLGFTGPFYADKETPLRRRQYEAVLQGLRDAWFAGAV